MNRKWAVTLVAVVTSVTLSGCNGGSEEPDSFGNGTFKVGVDVREGEYVTEGATDSKCKIEIYPEKGSGSSSSIDKGESKKIELRTGYEVNTAGCEDFVRQ